MEDICDNIKRPILCLMGIKEREVVQAKGIGNIFNKIIVEKSQQKCLTRYRKSLGQ
jgi:hypothetical protein